MSFQKISKLDSLYSYFARFWQHRPIRECFGKSKNTLSVGKTGTGRMFPPLSTQLWSLYQAKKRFIMRKLEELEQYPKFITIVNEAG